MLLNSRKSLLEMNRLDVHCTVYIVERYEMRIASCDVHCTLYKQQKKRST